MKQPMIRFPDHRVWRAALFFVLALSAAAPAASAQDSPIQLYRSPEFGYLFWWDADTWAVQEQHSTPAFDLVRLGSDDAALEIRGTATPGMTAESCLRDRLARLETDPTLVRFESLAKHGARPEVGVFSDGHVANSELILAFDAADTTTAVARESCIATDAGGGMLEISEWILGDAFNANAAARPLDRYETAAVLATITMPNAFLEFAASQEFPWVPFKPPVILTSPDGEDIAVFTINTFACADPEFASPATAGTFVAMRNTARGTITVYPEDFVVVDRSGRNLSDPFVQWLYPAQGGRSPVDVAPGGVAVAQLTEGETFSVHDPWGGLLFLTKDVGCQGGAGGAAPVLIDLD